MSVSSTRPSTPNPRPSTSPSSSANPSPPFCAIGPRRIPPSVSSPMARAFSVSVISVSMVWASPLASWPCILPPPVSIPARRCPLSSTAAPTTRPIWPIRSILVCARNVPRMPSSRTLWTNSWLPSMRCTQTWWCSLRTLTAKRPLTTSTATSPSALLTTIFRALVPSFSLGTCISPSWCQVWLTK